MAGSIEDLLARELPPEFMGYSTHMQEDGDDSGTLIRRPAPDGPIRPNVSVSSVRRIVESILGLSPDQPPDLIRWLTLPQQSLREIVSGPIFHDDFDAWAPLQSRFAWYPDDVWRYLLGAQWQAVGQLEPSMGRAAQVGDERGARLIAARLTRLSMELAFLIERTYQPYWKWFGTAFDALPIAARLGPTLDATLAANDHSTRDSAYGETMGLLVRAFNALELGPSAETELQSFHSRPFRVIGGERIAADLLDTITEPELAALPPVGSIDQLTDVTDLLSSAERAARLDSLYRPQRGGHAKA